jgi:hypothetical protein
MKSDNPGTQKSLGEKIKICNDWDNKKLDVMKHVNLNKYQQNPDLKEFLIKTENTLLAEDNPFDGFWGIKLSRNSPRSDNAANFKFNHMGHILMDIRSQLGGAPMDQ